MSTSAYSVRKATPVDLDGIKALADAHKHELGFVLRPALARSIARGMLLVAENRSGLVGFVEYYHRRDGQTTLYHIAVVVDHRREGAGRALIDALCDEARCMGQRKIRLKCPEGLSAQSFYAQVGFRLVEWERGRRRALAIWERWFD